MIRLEKNLYLQFPDLRYRTEYLDLMEEYTRSGEEIVPFGLNYGLDDFEAVIQTIRDYQQGINVKPEYVPATTWWLMQEGNPRILGAVNLRHRLNDYLLRIGGHIGYGIRPSERNQGYATRMLSLTLEKCRELKLEKVLITCDKANTASARVIRNNGGVLDSELEGSDRITQRYWITL